MKKSLLLFSTLILTIVATATAAAQSRNRDHPTPLDSSELRGEMNGRGGDLFYSFNAGPGDLTITLDVKSSVGTFAVPFELLNANGADTLLCCEYAQADAPGQTGRDVKIVKLRRRQMIILHLTESQSEYAQGTFHVRLSGAVEFAVASPVGGDGDRDRDRDGRGNGDNRMGMPANGTLLIRMRDGSTKEIDLSLVRTVSVKP